MRDVVRRAFVPVGPSWPWQRVFWAQFRNNPFIRAMEQHNMALRTFSTVEKLREVQREISFRKAVYARQDGGTHKLTSRHLRQVALMEAIEDDYNERLEQEAADAQRPGAISRGD